MGLFDLEIIYGISPATAVATLLIFVLAVIYYFDVGAPPGPRGLPYIGYLPFLSSDKAHVQLKDLKKKYGDVYSFKVLGHLMIHLGSLKAVREAHLTKSDCFAQRYEGFNVLTSIFSGGTACLNGEAWKVQRKFFVQAFREFGLTSTKKYMEGPMYDSLKVVVDALKAETGKPFNVLPILNAYCSAILHHILFNDDNSDAELKEVIEGYEKTMSLFTGNRMLLHGEFARLVIFPLMSDYRNSMKNLKRITEILMNTVKRHDETLKEDSVRDVIDAYLKERNDRRRKNDPTAKYFTERSLVSSLVQIVGDGTTSVAAVMSFFLLGLLDHPEEQDKLFEELQEVLGPDRQPTVDDRNKLVYMNAFMHEVLRTTDFIAMFPMLECTKETTLNGHPVPKGAITLVNFFSCHRDPEVFEDPDTFKPSRYIPQPGKQKPELPIVFGVGKRSCVGEYFTMLQMFLLLATVVKNFRLEKSSDHKINPLVDGKMEIIVIQRTNDQA